MPVTVRLPLEHLRARPSRAPGGRRRPCSATCRSPSGSSRRRSRGRRWSRSRAARGEWPYSWEMTRRLVDRGLGVDVVGADPDEDLEGVARGRRGHVGVGVVGVPERLALEVLELVVGGVAGQPGHRVDVVELQRRASAARRCRRARRRTRGSPGTASWRRAVAAAAGEDHHEEVDDAVLVGVVVGVVDLRVGDRRGVVDELAGVAAAGVDVLPGRLAVADRRAVESEP